MRHDSYEPAELRRLTKSLHDLHDRAYPQIGGSIMTLTSQQNRWPPEPDKTRSQWRLYLRRILYDLDQLSSEITGAVRDETAPKDAREARHGQCPICHYELRARARYCDRCGTHLQDARSENSQGA